MESGQFIPVVIVNPLKGIWALHSSVLPPTLSSRRFAVPDRFFSTDELGMSDLSGPGPLASQRLIGDSNSNADERHWTQTLLPVRAAQHRHWPGTAPAPSGDGWDRRGASPRHPQVHPRPPFLSLPTIFVTTTITTTSSSTPSSNSSPLPPPPSSS